MDAKYAVPNPIRPATRSWPDNEISESPIWCAVDLRDGNQALPNPMTPRQKKSYFKLLTEIGFREIEIGFPSASADDFQFCRDLIEQNMIPENVTISVLTQARKHLIERTFEALQGVKRAICHVYIASSDLHMKFVFRKTREEVKSTALDAVSLIRKHADAMAGSSVRLEFSPEEFTDSDLDFVVDLCDGVVEAWQPETEEKIVMNLPATVERRLPHSYADMIEAFANQQKYPDSSIISLHAHNDMGSAVAATELAVMAGGQRVEGTLFGHGERSGNVDLVTLALNLQYMGVETGLDFSRLEKIRDRVIRLTDMPVSPRHPYAGELVFSAFAGSHQDAIHKGLNRLDELSDYFGRWKIPYLHINPQDLGRIYEKFIRINSQSGKGGIAHVLQEEHGVVLPKPLLIELSRKIQRFADKEAREVESEELWNIFTEQYVSPDRPISSVKYWPRPNAENPEQIEGEVHLEFKEEKQILHGAGNGPIAAFVHALRKLPVPAFSLKEYEEDATGTTEDAEAVAFVRLDDEQERQFYGVGFGSNIDQAAVRAIVASLNRMFTQ